MSHLLTYTSISHPGTSRGVGEVFVHYYGYETLLDLAVKVKHVASILLDFTDITGGGGTQPRSQGFSGKSPGSEVGNTFYTGRLHPEIQPLTLLYTIFLFFRKSTPFVYLLLEKGTPFIHHLKKNYE